jgi:cell division protein FtsB
LETECAKHVAENARYAAENAKLRADNAKLKAESAQLRSRIEKADGARSVITQAARVLLMPFSGLRAG